MGVPVTSAIERAEWVRRGKRLEQLTIAWNCLEWVIAVGAGVAAGSVALVGFGIDSVIEVSSGIAVLWRLHGDHEPGREERALRIVGASFIALAIYVGFDAVSTLWLREAPERSLTGIVLAVLSLAVMPLLARAKRRVARGIGSAAMGADATQTELCAYLSGILLGGLVLNALFGFWWADPVSALVMVPIIAREGVEALRGKVCGCGDGGCH